MAYFSILGKNESEVAPYKEDVDGRDSNEEYISGRTSHKEDVGWSMSTNEDFAQKASADINYSIYKYRIHVEMVWLLDQKSKNY